MRAVPATLGASAAAVPLGAWRRKWCFRGLAFGLPLLMAAGVEVGLRIAGYGHSSRFFKPMRIGAEDFLVSNDDFVLRFFPPDKVRFPTPLRMPLVKPPHTCRIFILGESAAAGDPAPSYAAGRYLEILLRQRFPDAHFQVINVAVTAANSHAILPIARECARQQGDFWILYMGNNEMVGPFGPATVFGAQAPSLEWVRLNLALRTTRVGQLLAALLRRWQYRADAVDWGGLEAFLRYRLSPGDPRKETAYRSFRRNLNDIVQLGVRSKTKVLLNTVAVNLKDCSPLGLPDAPLPAISKSDFDRCCANACRAQEQGRFAEAAQQFEAAARLKPLSAELQFRLGRCLLAMTNLVEARRCLQLACDEDPIPARADSRINDIIRDTARRWAGPNLIFFDAASDLAAFDATGICGQELFYEHVHFNFRGNYLLARQWAGRIAAMLPPTVQPGAPADWASEETCERRLALTDWNRCSIDELLIRRFETPPLNGQWNNAVQVERLRTELGELRKRMGLADALNARQLYREMIQATPDDTQLYVRFAEFLAATGDLGGATEQWRKVCELMPFNGVAFYQVGWLLEQQGRLGECRSHLMRAVALRPSLAEGWFELGNVDFEAKNYESALKAYRRASELQPANVVCRLILGKTFAELKRHQSAIEQYQRVIRLRPRLWEAHSALGDEWVAVDRMKEAAEEFQAVIRLEPNNARAHISLGVVWAGERQWENAQREFEAALKLEPGNQMVREYLEQVTAWKSQSSEAGRPSGAASTAQQ